MGARTGRKRGCAGGSRAAECMREGLVDSLGRGRLWRSGERRALEVCGRKVGNRMRNTAREFGQGFLNLSGIVIGLVLISLCDPITPNLINV